MEGNARTWFTPKQKAELWERWKSGQCVADIARALERRNKSGVYREGARAGERAPCIGTTKGTTTETMTPNDCPHVETGEF